MLDGSLRDNLRYFTEGAYGPWRAVPRLLGLLEDYSLAATFFIPTWVVEHWPARCEAILRAGHEIAYHGHRHEVFIDCTLDQQLEIMHRSATVFKERLGTAPVGFRTPSGDWSPQTAALLRDFGVVYSSSMRGDDRPYFHPSPDGKPGLVEIPARWDIDDYTALAYFEDPDFPAGLDRISDFRVVERNWRAEFEGFHRDGLCWTTIFHPKVSAKPGRLTILRGLFEAIRAHDDVWIARCHEVAQWWLDQHGFSAQAIA
ncbi:polysaccharide deacetylase family protein [Labrys neptuniae]